MAPKAEGKLREISEVLAKGKGEIRTQEIKRCNQTYIRNDRQGKETQKETVAEKLEI